MAGVDSPKAHLNEPTRVSEIGSESQAATTDYKRHPLYSPSEWLFESISSIVALGCLIGIAVIFRYMDDKPLSSWGGRISLNATISILTTARATALMHGVSTFIAQSKWLHFKNGPRKLADFETIDGASRGVWGSFLLLTTTKWNLATIGAFITILRLAFSPFAQQVVLIEQRTVISAADSATIAHAYNYAHFDQNILANAVVESIPQDPGMQSAVLQGLYGTRPIEPFNCPGICRWPDSYISLGFKSECKNVTQATLQAATCEGESFSLQSCNMTTPAGVRISTRHYVTDLGTQYYMNASSLLNQLSETELPDTFPEITRFAIFRSTPDANFVLNDINITDCSLSLTAYEYTNVSANGSNLLASRREVAFGVKNPWTLETPGPTLLNLIYTNESTSGDRHIPALGITYSSLAALENLFESSMISTEWIAGNFVNRDLGVAAALIGDVDLNNRFDNMATSMTDYLRYGPNTRPVIGEVIESVPFVSIRWGFFVVPIVTEAFAILFAILSIFSNRRSRRVPLWKSSTLPVLACRHEERLGLLQTTGKDIDELLDDAKKAEVQLQ